jgi:hypothetical protein
LFVSKPKIDQITAFDLYYLLTGLIASQKKSKKLNRPFMTTNAAAAGQTRREMLKSFMKELSASIAQEDNTISGRVLRLLGGGEAPTSMSLQNVDVLLEPLWWLVFHAERKTAVMDLRDDMGIPGKVSQGFQLAFYEHFRVEGNLTPWQEQKIHSLCDSMRMLCMAQIRFPQDLEADAHLANFLTENAELIKHIRNQITHLEWDKIRKMSGKAAASKFMIKTRLRPSEFSKQNRGLINSTSSAKGGTERADLASDSDDVAAEDDASPSGNQRSKPKAKMRAKKEPAKKKKTKS